MQARTGGTILRPKGLVILMMILAGGCTSVFCDEPKSGVEPAAEPEGINWPALLVQSLGFLGVEHGFRLITEEGTRHPHKAFFDGYVDSLNSLHGWSDGDPFLVSYVGHPMQGAVTGFLLIQNDRKYRAVEFGNNRRYWKSRMRASGFAWAYSEQFELGPLSEASIGHTQAFFPQQGFVDQVVTPAIGLAWMIGEDSIDKYLIKRIEARVHNPVVRVLVRGSLNPSRSMANMLALRVPWHRDTRSGVWKSPQATIARQDSEPPAPQEIAPFEFLATARFEQYVGTDSRSTCIGGGGSAGFRIAKHWQIVGDVGGCKLTGFGENVSGDSLTYLIGSRWNAAPVKRWEPYAQILVGGRTLTHEEIDPVKKDQLEAAAAREGRLLDFPDHYVYTRQSQTTGLTVSGSAGLDVKLSSAIALRVADLRYMYSWNSHLSGINYSNALQVTSGLVVRFGTW